MSVKEFDKTFGLGASIDEEKKRFVNRIENSIFKYWEESFKYTFREIFENVCYQLGEDANHLGHFANFRTISQKDFIKTLRIIVALYKYYSTDKHESNERRTINSYVVDAIERANLNLGIKWNDGIFYPTGEKFLDEELIDASLTLLDKFPKEKKDLKLALENHYAKSLYGVVDYCYKAIEGICRQLLNNERTLDKNQEALLNLLQFSKYFDKIFLNFLKYAHEYSRHAGENRHDLKPEEVEGFLYLTCLIIRATIKASEDRNEPRTREAQRR